MAKPPAVRQELQVYQSSHDHAFALARTDVKIAECDNDSMVKALRYCMMLVGLREANIPSQLEFQFLKDFIWRHYPGHTVDELKLAFDMAVAGKLELGNDGAKCFENFSCEYVGRILSAYRQWAGKVAKRMDKQPPPPKVYTTEEISQLRIDYAFYLIWKARRELKRPLKWGKYKFKKEAE